LSKLMILDGAMGTMMQDAGMPPGARPDVFGLEHPELLEKIHRQYIEAGSRVIYTNTFGSNARKLHGSGHTTQEVVSAAVATAQRAAEEWNTAHGEDRVRIALDVGPTGEMMEPIGVFSFEDAYETYKEMALAGADAGADLIVFETMSDLYEVKAAVLAVKENTDLPVWVTMSFEENGYTFMGTYVGAMAVTLDGLGVDAMGINCSLGPEAIFPLIKEIKQWTDKPIIVKPNAGLPNPKTGTYDLDAEEFARQMEPYFELGISMAGGCCGTTPEFISALAARAAAAPDYGEGETGDEHPLRHGICSAREIVELDGNVHVIGECIHAIGNEDLAQSLREGEMDDITDLALDQADEGAEILDINVGLPDIDEPAIIAEAVRAVQGIVTLPLAIDSADPAAIEAGLRACNGRAILNSVNAEEKMLNEILPIAKKYGAAVVGLTMDKNGIPDTAEQRFALAEKIVMAAEAAGIPREDVLIDCLTLAAFAQPEQAEETLRAVRMVREQLGAHCVLGVSNISFGLPQRGQVTAEFLEQALACGLDLPILNPEQDEVMDAVEAFRAHSGGDET